MFHSTSMMCLMFTMFNKKTLNSRGLHEVSDVSWSFNMLQLLPVDSGQAIFENCLMPQTRRTWKWKGWKMVIDGHRSGRVAPGSMVGQPNMLDTSFICGKPKNDAWIFFTTSSPRGTTESENSGQTIFYFFGWFQNWEPKNCVKKCMQLQKHRHIGSWGRILQQREQVISSFYQMFDVFSCEEEEFARSVITSDDLPFAGGSNMNSSLFWTVAARVTSTMSGAMWPSIYASLGLYKLYIDDSSWNAVRLIPSIQTLYLFLHRQFWILNVIVSGHMVDAFMVQSACWFAK